MSEPKDWKSRARKIVVSAEPVAHMGVLVKGDGWETTLRTYMSLSMNTGMIVYAYYDPEIQDDKITHRDGIYPAYRRYEGAIEREEVKAWVKKAGGVLLADVSIPRHYACIFNGNIWDLTKENDV